jgi:hypothetical protein
MVTIKVFSLDFGSGISFAWCLISLAISGTCVK